MRGGERLGNGVGQIEPAYTHSHCDNALQR